MDIALAKPKITTEIESASQGVLIIGKKSPLASALWEVLISRGIKIDDPQDFNYVFQTANLEKIDFFLEKAAAARAKFFLILDENQDPRLAREAEEKTLKFIQAKKLEGKIIKLSGFVSGEEAVKKILKVAFSQTPEKIVTLAGPGIFWEKSKRETKVVVKKRFIFWGAGGLLVIFLLTLPITFILANIFLGTLALKAARAAVFSSQFEKGRNQAVLAQKHFAAAKNGFSLIMPVFEVLNKLPLVVFSFGNKEEKAQEFKNWLEVGENLGVATRHLVEVGQEGQKLARLVLGQEQGRTEELLVRVTADISLAEEELALIEARTGKPSILEKNFEQVRGYRKNLVRLKNFLGVAPWILGIGQKRTYLVLLQNNFELRPGGGFIGTLGFLTFDNGKLDLKIEDVYTADGQLRGHVEPPKPIREYLNQIHWYLRDSNWDPDFTVNAQKAAWFLEKELGIRVDGVVALDLAVAQKILGLTGPVNLSDYQEKITADNLFLKAQIYSQENFFPGSTQKRDFLSSLATALFTKFSANNNFPWLGMAKAVEEAAQEKHLFVYLNNGTAQKIVSDQGWGGEIKSEKCKNKNEKCLEDYLMVVEANLGVNKANYFLKREIKKEVDFVQDGLTSKVTITYENTSPANVSFGGTYKNYLRVLTPIGFVLDKIKIDDQEFSFDKVDKETLAGKNTTGFLVEVAPGTKKKVEFFYKIPIDPSWDEFTYQLLIQKQPGTDQDPFRLTVFTPSWQIEETNFPSNTQGGNLSFISDLSVDRILTVKLKRP